jgi:hypothetical protein
MPRASIPCTSLKFATLDVTVAAGTKVPTTVEVPVVTDPPANVEVKTWSEVFMPPPPPSLPFEPPEPAEVVKLRDALGLSGRLDPPNLLDMTDDPLGVGDELPPLPLIEADDGLEEAKIDDFCMLEALLLPLLAELHPYSRDFRVSHDSSELAGGCVDLQANGQHNLPPDRMRYHQLL